MERRWFLIAVFVVVAWNLLLFQWFVARINEIHRDISDIQSDLAIERIARLRRDELAGIEASTSSSSFFVTRRLIVDGTTSPPPATTGTTLPRADRPRTAPPITTTTVTTTSPLHHHHHQNHQMHCCQLSYSVTIAPTICSSR
jgi:hypothetical protein